MRLDHVAHRCHDPLLTNRFYTSVLGLRLVQAYAGKDLLLVYDLPGGGRLAFMASSHSQAAGGSMVDWEQQHIGLTVGTTEEFERWLKRLNECGVPHKVIEGERVYFADPDGVVLELEVASPMTVNNKAPEVLVGWVGDHH